MPMGKGTYGSAKGRPAKKKKTKKKSMKKSMLAGKTFTQAHKLAQKKVGK